MVYGSIMKVAARLLPLGLLFLTGAGDAPLLSPSRDVTIIYRMVKTVVAADASKLVVRQDAGGSRMRLDAYIFDDAKFPYESAIYDRKSNDLTSLRFARQLAVDVPNNETGIPGFSLTASMTFKRLEDSSVNGATCTNWDIVVPPNQTWTGCVDQNGVLLRSVSPTREVEATSVTFDPLPADTFDIPADLRHVPAPKQDAGKAAQPQ